MNEHGAWVQDHESKAGLLWIAFRNRMGSTSHPTMLFVLNSMIATIDGLDDLASPISHDEIDGVVKHMPSDKAPGPNGFNGLFLKKCWQYIKHDFYSLCSAFCSGTVNLECINTSYITLVPKKNSLETMNDFRPISLMNISLKVLTKILAERLQAVILQIVHPN
jgi:hypothetical protein